MMSQVSALSGFTVYKIADCCQVARVHSLGLDAGSRPRNVGSELLVTA